MKALFFLLLFPVAAFGGSYNYDKVISVNKGSDNFGFDAVRTADNAGAIEFTGNEILIDGKKFQLENGETPNMYKGKKCSVEMVYKSGELAMVKVYKANRITCYVISPSDRLITKNK